MNGAAAPPAGRRVPRGLLGALVAFMFLPVSPVLLAGPLAGQLLLARPASWRERIWLAAALLLGLSALAVGTGQGAARDVFGGAALAFSGLFIALTALGRRAGGFARAAAAAGFATAGTALGLLLLGMEWGQVEAALATQLRQAVDVVHALAPLSPAQRADLQAAAEWTARLYPGLAILGALAGGSLASGLAYYVSAAPVGPPPAAFRDFRFSDQLVWLAIAVLAGVLLPLSPGWRDLVGNVLVVLGGLYAARGTAVFLALAGRWPPGLRIALFLSAVLLLPYAVGGALVMGLADTWLDARRVLSPPPSEGTNE